MKGLVFLVKQFRTLDYVSFLSEVLKIMSEAFNLNCFYISHIVRLMCNHLFMCYCMFVHIKFNFIR